ncbi:MAG: signal recognition particle-docking protein FtsY [Halobacteriovoraceae bacterium]|nr:signal recognition particle-docking protein FtsY [Halobacteriovoraceae bacterium]
MLVIFFYELKQLFTKEETNLDQSDVKDVESQNKQQEVTQEKQVVLEKKIPWEKRLFSGLSKTRSEIWGKVGSLIGGKKIDDDLLEELEEVLFTSDLSPALVDQLLEELKTIDEDQDHIAHIKKFMKSKMETAQSKVNTQLYKFDDKFQGPKVIMIVGVNGAGKTTTIGKLATKLKRQGASVVVGACDTFRAAAVEQLEVWCQRAEVEIVKAAEGADPSGVAFDAVKKAKELGADYCIIDTAGRLHTKSNLMDELVKTKKVMSKVVPDAPHETLLVVDAITGQNALRQAEEFNKSLELSGLIFTKCDGSSKAGSAVSIVQSLSVPIVYIGVGEEVEDLNIFELDAFLNALLGIQAES